jgi:hypothetical protein
MTDKSDGTGYGWQMQVELRLIVPVYVKDTGPSDLTYVQRLWSKESIFTSIQNVWCLSIWLYMQVKNIEHKSKNVHGLSTVV